MRIPGVNALFHGPAAALVVDGRTVAAAEEERLSRRTHGKRRRPRPGTILPAAGRPHTPPGRAAVIGDIGSGVQAARRIGDRLVVCADSDTSVRCRKGKSRPVDPPADRVRVPLAPGCVEAVAVFDEDTPERLLTGLRPDVWGKGGDCTGADPPEAALLGERGGQAVPLPYPDGRSSTPPVARAAEGTR